MALFVKTSKRDKIQPYINQPNNNPVQCLKQVLTGTRKLFSLNKSERFQDVTKLSVQQTMVHVLCLRHRYVCFELIFLSWIIHFNKSLVFTRVCEGYSTNN